MEKFDDDERLDVSHCGGKKEVPSTINRYQEILRMRKKGRNLLNKSMKSILHKTLKVITSLWSYWREFDRK